MKKKFWLRAATATLVIAMTLATVVSVCLRFGGDGSEPSSYIELFDGTIQTNKESYYSGTAIQRLPDTVKDSDVISVIVSLSTETMLASYQENADGESFAAYLNTAAASSLLREMNSQKAEAVRALNNSGISWSLGYDYINVVSGFEILIKAGDFVTVCNALGDDVTTIVGEVYNSAKTETVLVENNVNVYETGIFNSSDFAYDGTGVVVAVLDTGLDYTHSAFSVGNFTADRSKLGLTLSEVEAHLAATRASELQSGLTASDVYLNEKVPFAFDYADEDAEVFPILSNHGTHVSGIIAGKDDTIIGVAPNAQLVEMKIFSDTESTSRTSWILAALEDCVTLGVDVINMSIGTSCGFSREIDKEAESGVYDRIREAGISIVVAASNSYTSTYGSEKNGNLGLTSNPDNATVGSPSTYNGALSVASISGVKTPYILYNDTIIYFTESTNRVSEEKNFFDDLFANGGDSAEIEYITIRGSGSSADYTGLDVKGKIVLVSRGKTTFEEKAAVAQAQGAAGIVIYNNVSGDIKMNVGDATIPVCSISQDDGEMLAAANTGILKINRAQVSGPFMSDFSSWGPAPDLGIKPEITAHGGSILSAVPGQSYDRISGTSMAAPNMSGVVALLRQYVKENFTEISENNVEIAATVNRLLMSTADIVFNTNGLPYAVRKQGAGLANLVSAGSTGAYILTYDRETGEVMDKSKIELGDDPTKTGVYTLRFSIDNFGSSAVSYNLSTYVMSEGVSETKTHDGETTVTEDGYILAGASTVIGSVTGGTLNGNNITVAAGQVAEVTVTITLSDSDKQYLNDSFENGMYVEGFVVLDATDESVVDLSVPYLAFYGDWTQAPMLDLDYYETNKDELDDSIDLLDKTLPDAYATRPIGGVYSDYVGYLGAYYFEQSPTTAQIAASRNYIALSNREGTMHSLRYIWAGLLRNAARISIVITDDATGEVVYERMETDVRKAYGEGGGIMPSQIEVEFDAAEQNLKNNTRYTVTMKTYLDYGDGGADTNVKNEFSFPFVADFEAPAITGCEFYTEYDRTTKTNRLFAKVAVYDNHYAMSMQVGYVGVNSEGYVLNAFDAYMTPVYSSYNSTSYVVYELTDYVNEIKTSSVHKNTFTIACYDYALNEATYEIALPDDFIDFYFESEQLTLDENGNYEITLNPNELFTLEPLIYPNTEWGELLEYVVTEPEEATVVNNKLLAIEPGAVTTLVVRNPNDKTQSLRITVRVRDVGDEGYVRYDKPVADGFYLTGYHTNKAYYYMSNDERDIGLEGDERKFPSKNSYSLSMFPSESVTVRYKLDAYFPDATKVVFSTSNNNIVSVSEDGTIRANAEGYATVTARVTLEGKNTYYSQSISIEVKDPYITTGASLTHYFGNGGVVQIPDSLAITEIGQYAFSNFDYVEKDEDEITEEDNTILKLWFLGESTIEEVVIPEGVERIGPYAFANLTALKRVVLPSTLETIDMGAFYGCTALTKVEGLEHVKFVNESAFEGCNLTGSLSLDKMVAIAGYAFAGNTKLESVTFSVDTQSIAAYAFAGNASLKSVTIPAEKIKLGLYAFSDCTSLSSVSINAAVIPAGAFNNCKALSSVTIGRDVAVIGEFAFRGSKIETLTVAADNPYLKVQANGAYILNPDGTELLLVAPAYKGEFTLAGVTAIGNGAFSSTVGVTSIVMPDVTYVASYAMADCSALTSVTLGKLTYIGDYAFNSTAITATPSFEFLTDLGAYSFAGSKVENVVIPAGMTVGDGAFLECKQLASVTLGDRVTVGENAFRLEEWTSANVMVDGTRVYYYVAVSPLHSLTIGNHVTLESGAFYGAAELESVTIGEGVVIGDYAFYNAAALKNVDLSNVISIGECAFSGDFTYDALDPNFTVPVTDGEGNYTYRYFAPVFTSVDLSSAQSIGIYAFSYCHELVSATLGDGLTALSEGVFAGCDKLTSVNTDKLTQIGDSAFAETALSDVDLSSADLIGEYAFVFVDELKSVLLGGADIKIGEGAFAYCSALDTVGGFEKVASVGDYAFAYTDITSADLSNASYIGTHAFMKEVNTPFVAVLGNKLTDMGDNPFAFCRLTLFSSETVESFNGKDYYKTVYTFDLSDTVRVIDGSVYRVVPYGLELSTYAGDAESVIVADGTVRISAMAFAGADVVKVVLPYTTASIGHKAFYGCESLTMVAFSSYDAPILEEEYDEIYFLTMEHIPATGDYTITEELTVPGLEIVPYFMWNVTENPSVVYYGASFVDYVGYNTAPIVMVRPVNGQNYDSFIYSMYFNVTVDGAAAADDITLAAIAAIARLPETVSLADKELVEAARAAYDLIATLEQRALVGDYYAKLTQAEKRISDLEYLANQNAPQTPGEELPPDDGHHTLQIVLVAVAGCIVLAAAAVVAIVLLRKKKSAKSGAQDETAQAEPDVSAEETATVGDQDSTEDVPASEDTNGEDSDEQKSDKA